MKKNFLMLTEWLLVHEGGYVNHPRDPGGATNKGVTQRVYDGYRDLVGLTKQSVKNITKEEAIDIYRTQYWAPIWGDDLPSGLDYAMYDFAVNSGPRRAIKFLQRLLKVPVDGIMGNLTMGAIATLEEYDPDGLRKLTADLTLSRLAWMKTLRTWSTFGRGWKRRLVGDYDGFQATDQGVLDRSLAMIDIEQTDPPTEAAPGKSEGPVDLLRLLIRFIERAFK
jgi:lysozyme family protein